MRPNRFHPANGRETDRSAVRCQDFEEAIAQKIATTRVQIACERDPKEWSRLNNELNDLRS